jgi:hypothetical protein
VKIRYFWSFSVSVNGLFFAGTLICDTKLLIKFPIGLLALAGTDGRIGADDEAAAD